MADVKSAMAAASAAAAAVPETTDDSAEQQGKGGKGGADAKHDGPPVPPSDEGAKLLAQIEREATGLAYAEPPMELYNTSHLDLSGWSIIIGDGSVAQMAQWSEFRSKQDSMTVEINGLAVVTSRGGPTNGLRTLNLRGADKVTDVGFQHLGRCAGLEELNASRLRCVTDAGLRAVARGCRQLVKLDLSYMVKAMKGGLASVGECCPHIRELSLAHCPDIPEWVLLRLFNGCGKLELLDLNFCYSVTDSALKAIAKNCSTITSLKLRNCRQVSDVGLLPLCQACAGLQYLDLAVDALPFRLSDVGLLAVGENCPELAHLDLFGREKLTDVGLSWLADGCHSLTHLNMGKCVKITDAGLRQLSEGCRELQNLTLADMKLVTDVGVRHLADGCRNLATLNIGGIWLLSDGVERDFAMEGLQALALGCPFIEQLSLTNCFRVAEKTLRALAKGPGPRFRFLNLAGCNGVNAKAFHNLMSVTHALEEIDLNGTDQVDDVMLHTLGRHCPRLHTVNLSDDTQVTDRGVMHLARGCRRLRTLLLTGCSSVGDASLMALCDANLSPGLDVLELAGCAGVTDTGVSWLADRATTLTKLSLQGTKCERSGLKAMSQSWKYAKYATGPGPFFGMVPKPRARDMQNIDEYARKWKSALMIQAHFRARRARGEFALVRARATMVWVAVRVQALARGIVARALARAKRRELERRMAAALVIQCVVRQHIARVMVKRRIAEIERLWRHTCATRVETRWRGVQARARYKVLDAANKLFLAACHRGATLIQACWRGRMGRSEFMLARANKVAREKEQKDAATYIQSIFRGYEARRELKRRKRRAKKLAVARQACSIEVQRVVRGRAGRNRAREARTQAHDELKASVMIQAKYRGRKGQVQAHTRKNALREALEYAAVIRIQAGWRARTGRFICYKLQAERDESAEELVFACRLVQRAFRGYLGREAYRKQQGAAREAVATGHRIEAWGATRIQAAWRGCMGRVQYTSVVDEKKKRWKEMADGDGLPFFYNIMSGEMRRRRPQDLLDLLPRPTCGNCAMTVKATKECSGCKEYYCDGCFAKVHGGGKRKTHKFRTICDFYNRRIDYGEGEFPSKWPSEIEQDEMAGWKLRVAPVREPKDEGRCADGVVWERYTDDKTGREFFRNTEKHAQTTYDRPAGFRTPRAVVAVVEPDWVRHEDEHAGRAYFYNAKTLETTFVRPPEFSTPRGGGTAAKAGGKSRGGSMSSVAVAGRGGGGGSGGGGTWTEHADPATGTPYFFNIATQESTYERPAELGGGQGYVPTPRQGQVALAAGVHGWGKFENDGREYFFNSATGESAWQRPPGFMTPRAGQDVATSAGVNGWEQHWDEDGRQYYYYNSATGESSFERPREFFTPREGQLAVVSAGSWGKYVDEGSGQSYYHNAEVRGSPVPTRLLRWPRSSGAFRLFLTYFSTWLTHPLHSPTPSSEPDCHY